MMPDNMLHKLIYVLFSAFTEFLPVSPRAHQMLYELLTGFQMTDPFVTLTIRLGGLVALIVSCNKRIRRLLRDNRHAIQARRHRNSHVDMVSVLDIRVLKTASIPILLSFFFVQRAQAWIHSMALLALTLALGGLFIFIPRIMPCGNKDSRNLSRLDSISMGLGGALAIIPGFSRMGGILSAGQMRGVERNYALDVSLLISIPSLLCALVFDVYAVIMLKTVISGIGWLCYFLMFAISFAVAYVGIMFLRLICLKNVFTRFSYYSWGMAMLVFLLYLLI